MPNIKSAAKRAKTSIQNRIRNRGVKSEISTANKKFLDAVSESDKPKVEAAFRTYCSVLDKAAKKGVIKKNNASRHKSRAALKVKAIA